MLSVLALVACERGSETPAQGVQPEEKPDPLAGSAQEYGLGIKSLRLKRTDQSVDARFEIKNGGRAIVSLETVEHDSGPEAALDVELFRHGKWQREPSARPEPAAHFDDLWPDATLYGRTTIPADAHWARVLIRARGLVGKKDGATASGVTEVSSDAFELPASD